MNKKTGNDLHGFKSLVLKDKDRVSEDDPSQKIELLENFLNEELGVGAAEDGWGLKVMGIKGKTLKIRCNEACDGGCDGGCESCPATRNSLFSFIESVLRRRMGLSFNVVPV